MQHLIFLLCLFPILASGQEIDEDYLLKGTTVLPWTENHRHALYHYGYILSSIASQGCANSEGHIEELSDEVIASTVDDSVIQISIRKFANCSDAFLGEIQIIGDTLINLITHGYGGRSTCACCFTLTFTIETEGINTNIRFAMIDGDERTLMKFIESN